MSTKKQVQKKANGSKKTTQGKGPKQQQQRKAESHQVMAPTAMSRVNTTRKPSIKSLPNGDCRIHHREFLRDINAGLGTPTNFQATVTEINPGLPATFPWLSQVAQRFERYKFSKLHFIFESQAPTSLGGALILSIDYDASDPTPLSKQQAMAYKNSVRTSPWNECTHASAKEDLSQQKQYFVRSGPLAANNDIKLYDVGNLFTCSQGVTTPSAAMGELYVEYDVMLHTPNLTSFGIVGGSVVGGGTLSNASPLGTAPVLDPQSIGITIDSNSILTFTDQGDYLVNFYLTGTTLTPGGLTAVVGSGLTPLPNSGSLTASTATAATYWGTFRVNSLVNATLDFSAIAATYTTSVLIVAEAPNNSIS
jgi:hypothetical protein